ncbi:conserved hypothetical protein [Burkholderiales bacterium 8X]|nr:conserved hypothetical protein [Burkholderiales bacterium 8X]
MQVASDAAEGLATTGRPVHPSQTAAMSLQNNKDPVSDNVQFAVVLAGLVRDRCKSEQAKVTLRTGLQASVPVNERPYVRRGLDALIDHGVLTLSGENIGLSRLGQVLLDQAAETRQPTAANHADTASVQVLREALANDDRLEPARPIQDIMTLPGRLEGYRDRRREAARRSPLLLLLLAVLLIAAVWLYRAA